MEALKLEATPKKKSALSKITTKGTSTKSKIEIDRNNVSLADEVIALKKELKNAEAKFEIKANELIAKAKKLYEKKNALENSFKFQGTDETLTVSFKNQFTNIDFDLMETLQKKFPQFDKYFYEKRDIKLIDTSDETIDLLDELLGDKFSEIFEAKQCIGVCKDMNVRQFELPEDIRVYVKQFKPSVR